MTSTSPQRGGWTEVAPGYFELDKPIDQRAAHELMKVRIEQTNREARLPGSGRRTNSRKPRRIFGIPLRP